MTETNERELIEIGTKIDLFRTSNNWEILEKIKNEIRMNSPKQSEGVKEYSDSKRKTINRNKFKTNIPYLCEKIKLIQQERYQRLQVSKQTWAVNIPPCTNCRKSLLPKDFQEWVQYSQCNVDDKKEMEKVLSCVVLCSTCSWVCREFI